MELKLSIMATSLLLMLAHVANADAAIFDVTKYGAKAGGEISKALTSAWKDACASTSSSTVSIPAVNYTLSPVVLQGPCKAAIGVHVQGTLKAPADPSQFKTDGWVVFQYIDQFTLSGTGTFDGQGAMAWKQNDCAKNKNCRTPPTNIRFDFLNNTLIRDITSKDSKQFHINVLGCNNVTFVHVTITAPGDSINTDGIHIGRASGINITDALIQTGDDCLSIGDGGRQIHVERVTCGPGHGISVGSLGKYKNEEPVVGITVTNCTISNTMNGVRVKTWRASPVGTASDMHFENIVMENVGNPIIIDQEYCPSGNCNNQPPSQVKISRVSLKNIRGTSSTRIAVKLDCSKSVPCENVEVGDINLTYKGPGGEVAAATSECENVKPKTFGTLNPKLFSSSG
ncbi:exopolygalacturonase-like [Cornus florida]|uniref:exopolygalacturonase-like n=1 Tax=Cornus florida TaxID=4283 RepID=UPI00289F8816|nr:exopolygalacturonase-like [Cornus florida]